MKKIFVLLIFSFFTVLGLQAQEFHMPPPSPKVTINQAFSTSFVKLAYSRPALRGRTVFGNQLPFGKVWRTGANASTKITFGEDISFGGQQVKAGEYALYTIPNQDEWTVILNTEDKNWGAVGYDAEDNVAEVKVPVKRLQTPRESLSITLEDLTNNSANLVISWGKYEVKVSLKADNNQRILSYLEKALKGDNPPYLQAAGYYLSTRQNLDEALEYSSKAIEKQPKAWYIYWQKAQILQALGRHKEAVDFAKQARDIAAELPAFKDEFEQHYQEMLKKG